MKTKKTSKARKLEIFDAFLAEVRAIGRRQIRQGVDAGDPLAQVRACCNVLEHHFTAYEQTQSLSN